MSDCDYLFDHILLLADEGTGRETLRKNHMKYFSDLNYKKTIGVELGVKSLTLEDDKNVDLQFWDIANNTNLKSLYYKNAPSAILLYDITNKESFNNLEEFLYDVRRNAGDIPILLVGNKLDLSESREVSSEQALTLIEQYNLSGPLEISAKTGENVEEMFIQLTRLMLESYI